MASGSYYKSPRRYAPTLSPEEESGILSKVGRQTLGGISRVGNFLDIPGSMVRDVVGGENPLDQLLPWNWTTSNKRLTGRDLARKWEMAGRKDTWPSFMGGLGLEIALDPLTYMTLGGAALYKGTGTVARGAGLLKKATDIGKARYGAYGPRTARQAVSLEDLYSPANKKAIGASSDVASRKAIERTAAKQGVDLTEDVLKKPLGGVAGVGPPIGDPWRTIGKETPYVGKPLGAVSAGMDIAGHALKQSAPIRVARSLFDSSTKGLVPGLQQELAGNVHAREPAAKAAARGSTLEAENLIAQGFKGFKEAFGDDIIARQREVQLAALMKAKGGTALDDIDPDVVAQWSEVGSEHVHDTYQRALRFMAEEGPEETAQKFGLKTATGSQHDRVKSEAVAVFGENADEVMSLMTAHAGLWAKKTGQPADEWFKRVKKINKGALSDVGQDALLQGDKGRYEEPWSFALSHELDPRRMTRDAFLKRYIPHMAMALKFTGAIDASAVESLGEAVGGSKNVFHPDGPLMKTLATFAWDADMHSHNWHEPIEELLRNPVGKQFFERVAKVAGVAADTVSDPDPAKFKALAQAIAKRLPESGLMGMSASQELLHTAQAIDDPLEYAIKTWEKADALQVEPGALKQGERKAGKATSFTGATTGQPFAATVHRYGDSIASKSGGDFYSEFPDELYATRANQAKLLSRDVTLNNPLVVKGNVPQMDLLHEWAHEGDETAKKLIAEDDPVKVAVQGFDEVDKYIADKVRGMGHDGIVYLGDPYQSGNEVFVFAKAAPTTTDAIRKASLKLGEGKTNVRVRIADLGKELKVSKEELDKTLLEMERSGELSLYPLDDPRQIRQEDIDAALKTSTGNERHLVYFGGATPTPTKEGRKLFQRINILQFKKADGGRELHLAGKRIGETRFRKSNDVQAARRVIPDAGVEVGDKTYRIGGIDLDSAERDKGLGKLLYLDMMDSVPPGAWFYNSQSSEKASRALQSLSRNGLIELHWMKRKGTDVVGSNHVARLTEKGRSFLSDEMGSNTLYQGGKGAVEFDQLTGEAVVTAFKGADISTLAHETAHIFRRSLGEVSDDLLIEAEAAIGVQRRRWTRENEEAFADGFERYLKDGSAPTPGLKGVFESFRGWLMDIYKSIVGTRLAKAVSPQLKSVFDKMLKNDGPAKQLAEMNDIAQHMVRTNRDIYQQAHDLGFKTGWLEQADSPVAQGAAKHFPRTADFKTELKQTSKGFMDPQGFQQTFRVAPHTTGVNIARTKVTQRVPTEIVNDMLTDPEIREGRINDAAEHISATYDRYLDPSWNPKQIDGLTDSVAKDQHANDMVQWVRKHKQKPMFTKETIDDYQRYHEHANRLVLSGHAIHELFGANMGNEGISVAEAFKAAGMDGDKALAQFTKRYGAKAANASVPQDVAEAARALLAPRPSTPWGTAVGEAIDRWNRLFKTNVTVMFPAFLARNHNSGQFVNVSSGHINTPTQLKAYGKEYANSFALGRGKGDQATLREIFQHGVIDPHHGFMDTDLTGAAKGIMPRNIFKGSLSESRRAVAEEIASKKAAGATSPTRLGKYAAYVGEAGEDPTAQELLSFLDPIPGAKKARTALEAGAKTGAKANYWVEWQNRVPMFMYLKNQGYEAAEAASIVKQMHFDYADLTPFEKSYMKRVVPFYTFTRKVAPLILKTLMERPQGVLGRTITTTGRQQTEDQLLPEHVTQGTAIASPFGQPPEGKRFITGLGLAHEVPLGFLGGGVKGAASEAMSMVNPPAKGVMEHAADYSFWQRRPLSEMDPNYGRTIANIRDRITGEKTRRATPIFGSPGLEQILGNLPTARAGTLARKWTDPRKDPLALALDFFTGLKQTDVSPQAMDAEAREAAENYAKRHMSGRTFQRMYIPDEDKSRMSEIRRREAEDVEAFIATLDKRMKEWSKANKK